MAQVLIDFHLNEEKIAENAEKEAAHRIVREMFQGAYGGMDMNKIRGYVLAVVKEILEPQKDEIIEEAIKEVVANLHRTKAVKEMLADAADGS